MHSAEQHAHNHCAHTRARARARTHTHTHMHTHTCTHTHAHTHSDTAWGIVHPTKVRYGRDSWVEIKPPEGPRIKGVVVDVVGAGDYVVWLPRCVCGVCVCVGGGAVV